MAFVIYCLIPGKGYDRVEKYLVQDSIWMYENKQYNVQMELTIDHEGTKGDVIKYNIDGKEGQWTLGIGSDGKELNFCYVKHNASYSVWQGRGNIRAEKITIKNIAISKNLSLFIKDKDIPKKVEEETLPKEIQEIVFERVK